ncbi:UDP-2,4-diacetamido-2,4,6-trideoxy-beta-L-altropyranose hydrolase [Stappia sp.]|uniref:UDP-2,4-diacetamido-2,4, 6-trideoxy-beta-L-altropyranose hydrolase n=1 Tax=Stappia sp. TaxID=1870903 RepID=UPI0032D98703
MSGVFAIRTDASAAIGSGHIRRMTILARYLKAEGLTTLLLCGPDTEAVLPAVRDVFDTVTVIGTEDDGVAALAGQDAELVGVFFDHYGLGADTHRMYRKVVPFLAAIDDMADRVLDVDMVFDVNLGRDSTTYSGLVPDHTELHVGSRFQIIDPIFVGLRQACLSRRQQDREGIARLFIAMGGTDPFGMTVQALETAAETLPEARIDVVAGSMTADLPHLRASAARYGDRVALHVDATNVAQLMCQADLAIGAGGTMTWERNCLGLPSVVLVLTDNQTMVGSAMAAAEAAIVLDAQKGYPDRGVADALTFLAHHPETLRDMGRKAAELGGEDGAALIARTLNARIEENRKTKEEA